MPHLAIHYREFWDRPRLFVVIRTGRWVLFSCQFDEELDDYPDRYTVGLIEPDEELIAAEGWQGIERRVVERVGEIPVTRVAFNGLGAEYGIDSRVLNELGLEA